MDRHRHLSVVEASGVVVVAVVDWPVAPDNILLVVAAVPEMGEVGIEDIAGDTEEDTGVDIVGDIEDILEDRSVPLLPDEKGNPSPA